MLRAKYNVEEYLNLGENCLLKCGKAPDCKTLITYSVRRSISDTVTGSPRASLGTSQNNADYCLIRKERAVSMFILAAAPIQGCNLQMSENDNFRQ